MGRRENLASEIRQAATTARRQPPPGSNEAEEIADRLLSLHRGHLSGAHSERPGTRYQSKHSRHRVDLDVALSTLDCYIETQDIITAEAAGLGRREYLIWHFVDEEGVTQQRMAAALGISQSTVSRILAKAREELAYLIDRSARRVFREESRRSAYFAPAYRPQIDPEVEEERYRMECAKEISTHIQSDNYNLVEIWRGGVRQMVQADDRTEKPVGITVGAIKHKLKMQARRELRMRKIRGRIRRQGQGNMVESKNHCIKLALPVS